MAQINITLGFFVRGAEDRNEDDQESVICFLLNKPFNISGVFIYTSIKILVLILVLRFPSIVCPSLFCGFSDQPQRGYLSLGGHR